MITVEAALMAILKDIKRLEPEESGLKDSLGRILAEDMHSNDDIPAFDNSAMDGYAVIAADTQGASPNNPKILEVIEDIKAGEVSNKRVKKNQAIRIMTGAPVPCGADSVIMVEFTQRVDNPVRSGAPRRGTSNWVKVFQEVKPGENIRRKGEDIKKGELVLSKGGLLTPAHIGILASIGKAKIKVACKPKVAVLATGDELIRIDKRLSPGKLRSSNTYTLYSQVIDCGAIPKDLGIAKDKPKELEKKIKRGLDCDLILTSGGVSVGDYDLVKDILVELGTRIKFWRVAMRPGKPLVFGCISSTGKKIIPVFGLPGNPVSSMVSFEVFVRPALLKMQGFRGQSNNEVEAVLEEGIQKKKGLKYFLRARTEWKNGAYSTRTTGPQGSGILKSMGLSNSLIIIPEGDGDRGKGEKVKVKFLNREGER